VKPGELYQGRIPVGLSRREFLAALPGTVILSPLLFSACGDERPPPEARARHTYEPVASLTEPELVTVSDREAIFTWVTDSLGDSLVYLGTDGREEVLDLSAAPSRYHYAALRGLAPDTDYTYRIRSGDRFAPVTDRSPGTFRTLSPPPGDFLFDFATVNDTHVGEEVAGLICIGGTCLGEGFRSPWPEHPYWQFTNEAAVAAINEIGPAFVIHKGDVSSEFRRQEFETAKAIFDALKMPYHVLRGNHDRLGDNDEDSFAQVFGLESTYRFFSYREHLFILLDSVEPRTGLARIDDRQFLWLEEVLSSFPHNRVFLFLHHPVTEAARFWSLVPSERVRLVGLLARHGKVAGVFSGHSHRACVTHDPSTGTLPFVETPSTKEYPGGFAYYRVYSAGYLQSFYRTSCGYCLPWFETTKGEYWGLAPRILFGRLEDRNFAYRYPESL